MSKSPFSIFPERYSRDLGWYRCTAERATSWAIVTSGGVTLWRFETKRAAKEHLARQQRLLQPTRTFSLGARCPARLAVSRLLAQGSNPRRS